MTSNGLLRSWGILRGPKLCSYALLRQDIVPSCTTAIITWTVEGDGTEGEVLCS